MVEVRSSRNSPAVTTAVARRYNNGGWGLRASSAPGHAAITRTAGRRSRGRGENFNQYNVYI